MWKIFDNMITKVHRSMTCIFYLNGSWDQLFSWWPYRRLLWADESYSYWRNSSISFWFWRASYEPNLFEALCPGPTTEVDAAFEWKSSWKTDLLLFKALSGLAVASISALSPVLLIVYSFDVRVAMSLSNARANAYKYCSLCLIL